MHATHILYHAATPPPMPYSHTGVCRICGDTEQGIPFAKWVADTFTNHDQLLPGDIICAICQFAFAQGSDHLAARAGKDKPQKMQNYSHIVLHGEWHPLHKGQKAEILTLLRQSPELVAISTSGQKHVVFRARPGWWQVEEQCVAPNLPALDACLDLIAKLYRIMSKTEIETGNYSPGRAMQYALAYGVHDLLATEAALKAWRGTAYFDLALYLAQKEEEDNGLERLPDGVSHGVTDANPPMAGTRDSLQTTLRPQHLGAIREQYQGSGLHQQDEQVLQLDLWSSRDSLD